MTTPANNGQCNQLLKARRLVTVTCLLFTFAATDLGSVKAATRTRLYDFEEGTAGSDALSVEDKIDDLVVDSAFGCCFAIDSHISGTNLGIPEGVPIQTWINDNVDPTPSMDSVFGTAPTFIDVSDGTALDSPANLGASTLAIDFDGTQALETSAGFRDTFVARDAFNNDEAASNNNNVFSTFFALSQAWVYPDSANSGSSQLLWGVGRENGGVRITSDGFWEMTALGPPGDITSLVPVEFDQWTHVAVARGGGSATLYIDGAIAAIAPPPGGLGFFDVFGDFVNLGTGDTLSELFDGKIDDFSVSGNSNANFDPFQDLDFFADLSIPEPTNVPGDVDQDGDADMDDYAVWSSNVGLNNTFGEGDITTLIRGDLDQNGQVDFFDFQEIVNAAAAAGAPLQLDGQNVPEPSSLVLLTAGVLAVVGRRSSRLNGSSCEHADGEHAEVVLAARRTSSSGVARRMTQSLVLIASFCLCASVTLSARAEIVVAEDFFYNQLTETGASFAGGNRFGLQSYGGGQNGAAGFWDERWGGFGAGTIISDDVTEEPFTSNTFTARVSGENSAENNVRRDFQFADSVGNEQTLYFSAQFLATPTTPLQNWPMQAELGIFSPSGDDGSTLVSVGIQDGTFYGNINGTTELGDPSSMAADNTDDNAYHAIVGKLEFNVATSVVADYNGSGSNDGGDFLLWQRNSGIDDGSAGFGQGDGTGEGNVDGDDLALWNQNYAAATDRLTVFIDPTGIEESNGSTLVVEANFGSGINDADLNPQVFISGGVAENTGRQHFVDDVVVGTTWSDVTTTLDVPRLSVEVNTTDGSVSLINNTSADIDLAFYEIESASGSLDTAGWNSLDDQNFDGGEWLENSPAAELLTESNFTDATTIAASGGALALGNAFETSGTQDLVVRWGTKDGGEGLLNLANVSYVSSSAATGVVPEPTSLTGAFVLLLSVVAGRRLY